MKVRNLLIVVGMVAIILIIAGSFSAGVVASQAIASSDLMPFLFSKPEIVMQESVEETSTDFGDTPEDLKETFEPFWQAWNLVMADYVDQPVDQELMMQSAIRGMLEGLGDKHTSYLDPEMFEEANSLLEGGEYEGIGAWVDISGDFLVIISPMPGSPAEKAGLQPNDKVVAVNGEDMTGVDGEVVRSKIIGPANTTVKLTIAREGEEEPFDVEIERASIVVPTVKYEMREDGIGYIRLFNFSNDTTKELRTALKDLKKQDPKGLILDLRYNGGGLLPTAIEVVSEFIGDGIVMYEEYGDGRKDTYNANPGGLATEIPLVVLINEGSASASEIVAGAIQDRDRGELVGSTSYGKGSVQLYTPLKNEQGAVRITIARWLTPNGRQIMGVGLEPDYIIEITPEDRQSGSDPQLDKAVELLTQMN